MSAPFLMALLAFLLAAAIGMPVALAMMLSGIGYLFATGQDIGLASEQILNGLYNSYVLLAVPLFIFAANIMNAGGLSDRLLAFCLAVTGRLRGGLAQVNIVASVIFSGMSGSALADAAGVGKLVISMMVRSGHYTPGFAAAVTAASATIGPIIPPSIPMVLYALVSGTSVGHLFLGGVLPGLLMAGALMAVVGVIAHKRALPRHERVAIVRIPGITLRALPVLMLPVILLGSIYGGVTTPTEAAAIAGAYALLLATTVYRTLGARGLVQTLHESSRTTAIIALVVGAAFLFNYVVAAERVPQVFAEWVGMQSVSPIVFLLGVNLCFLLFGCFLDATTMLLVLVPLLIPSCRALGIDLVHFGVVIVLNMMIGLITPPYGMLLFVINGVTGISLREMIVELWPFLLMLVVTLVFVTLNPQTVLWLPRQFGYVG